MENVGLVTSIRYDSLLLFNNNNNAFVPSSRQSSRLYMLSFHRDRILAAARAADRPCTQLEDVSGLELLADTIQKHASTQQIEDPQALKIRVVVAPNADVDVTSSVIPAVTQITLFPRSLDDVFIAEPIYRIYISPIECTPSFHTRFKTTNRSQYDHVRSVLPMNISGDLLCEALVVNEKGEIMEGSFTTPYFHRDGAWVTPTEASGGNLGVTRRWALEQGLCKEGLVNKISFQRRIPGEKIILSNGARGFGWGRIEPLEKSWHYE